MKKILTTFAGAFSILIFSGTSSLAAGTMVLTNGGLGQRAADAQSFGVAICNEGSQGLAQSVPVLISANGSAVTITSAAPIKAGSCAYSYTGYQQFGMAAGQSYPVTVTIDPNHTIITNANNQALYTVAVPGAQVAAAASAPQAQAGASTSFLATIGAAFANFFAALWRAL